MNDIEFLEGVVAELDKGWVTGTMCNSMGKCLVGAGAAAMGWRYLSELEFNELEMGDEHDFVDFDTRQSAIEVTAGARLFDLLRFDVVDDCGYTIFDNGDKTDLVVEYNDSRGSYDNLRPVLVAKLEELRSEQ